MSQSPPSRPAYVVTYTVCLFVVSALSAMMVFAHQMFIEMIRQEDEGEIPIALFRFLQAVDVILCLATLAVGVLRSRQSPLAGPTTAAVSILLVMWLPFGTAMFIWWVVWVRRQERCPECGRETSRADP